MLLVRGSGGEAGAVSRTTAVSATGMNAWAQGVWCVGGMRSGPLGQCRYRRRGEPPGNLRSTE
eukprot:3092934-Prymnesium_polylepis.1